MTGREKPSQEGARSAPSSLSRLSEQVNLWCERLLFVLMVAMILFSTVQVVFRVFFTALSWTEEITCFLLFYTTLAGTAVACKRGSHIAITFIVRLFPSSLQRSLAVAVHLSGIFFFGVMAYFGALLMKTEATQTSPGLQIPMTWVYAAFPVAGTVVMLHLLAGIVQAIRGK